MKAKRKLFNYNNFFFKYHIIYINTNYYFDFLNNNNIQKLDLQKTNYIFYLRENTAITYVTGTPCI